MPDTPPNDDEFADLFSKLPTPRDQAPTSGEGASVPLRYISSSMRSSAGMRTPTAGAARATTAIAARAASRAG